MRIPSHRDRDDARESSSMTPMIDVVFLLLIFFVCAAAGQVREAILPTDLAAGALDSLVPIKPEDDPRLLHWLYLRRTDDDRTVFEIDNARFDDFESLHAVLSGLAELAPDDPIILDIAPAVPVGDMIRVYDTCGRAGFQSINFATEAGQTLSGPNGEKT